MSAPPKSSSVAPGSASGSRSASPVPSAFPIDSPRHLFRRSITISTSSTLTAPSPPLTMSPKPASMPGASTSPTASAHSSPRFPSSPSLHRTFSDPKRRLSAEKGADEPIEYSSQKRQRIIIESVPEREGSSSPIVEFSPSLPNSSLQAPQAAGSLFSLNTNSNPNARLASLYHLAINPHASEPDLLDDDLASAAADASASASFPSVCPYLDTVNRRRLDFDFEKVCSISLSNMNIYGCLVCGKYFSGRGRSTHAYAHSLSESHHVFINLHTKEIYCLPDGYRVHDSTLSDIQYNVRPEFSVDQVRRLDLSTSNGGYSPVKALDGGIYYPSLMGLNNLGRSDWFNVIIQALNRVSILRDYYLLLPSNSSNVATTGSTVENLTPSFADLLAKFSSSYAFKSHVSPHELFQTVSISSARQFEMGRPADPFKFLNWFINALSREQMKTRGKSASSSSSSSSTAASNALSIVQQCFQGKVMTRERRKIESSEIKEEQGKKKEEEEDNDDDMFGDSKPVKPPQPPKPQYIETSSIKPFMFLSLPLPSVPLFRDRNEEFLIPKVALTDLLNRFNGIQEEIIADTVSGSVIRTMHLHELPPYIIIHYQRFTSNHYFIERNPTLIQFPLQGLDLAPYLRTSAAAATNATAASSAAVHDTDGVDSLDSEYTSEKLAKLSISELKSRLSQSGLVSPGFQALEKGELIEKLMEVQAKERERSSTRYDLIANVFHDNSSIVPAGGAAKKSPGEADFGCGGWHIHLWHEPTQQWKDVHDLSVSSGDPATMPGLVALSETYIQIYQRKI